MISIAIALLAVPAVAAPALLCQEPDAPQRFIRLVEGEERLALELAVSHVGS